MHNFKKQIRIVCANLKGGVGKTTTASAIAYVLGQKGYKTLAVDTDSQCNLTSLYGFNPDDIDNSIYEIMMKTKNINDCIIKDVDPNVDLLPGSPYITKLEVALASQFRKEDILNSSLDDLKQKYDFIIFDTAPALNTMTSNVFMASDQIIIPSEPDIFSLKAINSMNDTINEIRTIHPLNIIGILLTRVERLSGDKIIMKNSKQLAEILNTKTFLTYIRAQKNVKESRICSMNVVKYSEENRRKGYEDAGSDYEKFVNELLKELKEIYK